MMKKKAGTTYMNFQRIISWCFLLMGLIGLSYTATSQDTAVMRPAALWFSEHTPLLKKPIDTNLAGSQVINPARQEYTFYQDLGNYGSPTQALQYTIDRPVGFQHGIRAFDLYIKRNDDQHYWDAIRPFTDIQYAQGKGRTLLLNALHTQNINSRWNVGLQYNRVGAKGLYLHQNTDWFHTRFFSSYKSKNQRYSVNGSIVFNKGNLDMNGGVTNPNQFDSAFADILKEGFATRLQLAYTKVTQRTFHLKQSLLFPIKKKGNDSLMVNPIFSVSHIFDYEYFSIHDTFAKADLPYFNNTYNDTNHTVDSARYRTITNKIEISNTGLRPDGSFTRFLIQAGVSLANINWYNANLPGAKLYNLGVYGTLRNNAANSGKLLYRASLNYIVAGYNQFDYKLDGEAGLNLKYFVFKSVLISQRYLPDEILRNYNSNHYIWTNRFEKSQFTSLKFVLESKPMKSGYTGKVQVELNNVVNPAYLDTGAAPVQQKGTFTWASLNIHQAVHYKKLYLRGQFLYQQSGGTMIRVPKLAVYGSLYIQARYGSSPLKYQIGFDVYWNSSFKGYAWDPSLHQFYIQNSLSIGNYPMIDVFLNGEVKKFNLFVKLEHAFQPITYFKGFEKALPLSYYSSPYYPFQGQVLRMGFRWRFYN